MSDLRVASLKGRKPGSAPSLPDGAVVSGVTTSTSFSGNVTGNVTGTATGKVTGNVTGNITGAAGTFSGNVSIGGTITYEDVTSIDSVGVITARDGIRIGAGQSVSAVSGIVTYYGDGSGLTGVESGVVNFVASGTIANGATVIIKADGTVSSVAEISQTVGTPVIFESAGIQTPAIAFDSNSNKVVIAYKDSGNSYYGTAVVGTVSGTSISFGTPVVYHSGTANTPEVVFDSNSNKVVIVFRDNSDNYYGKAIVGTVSGTSISFGSVQTFESANTTQISATFDSNSNKVVIAYNDGGNSNRGTAIVGTVSGTSISFGTPVVYNSSFTDYIVITFDSNSNKVVIAYKDNGNSNYGTAIVGTVSGTSISFGSEATYESAAINFNTITFDSNSNKVVIAYEDLGNSDYGTAVVGTVSGTSISFGTPVVFESASMEFIEATFDSINNKVVIAYQDEGNSSYGTLVVGTVSGTSISFGTPVVYESAEIQGNGITFDSNENKVVIAYADNGNSNYGTSVVFRNSSTNLTSENYIGIAAEAIANTATGRINVVAGTNSGQTGLTTAQKYFVQPNGTLATSAGNPSVVAGTAISSTKIVVR
jgi:hypothetical protein